MQLTKQHKKAKRREYLLEHKRTIAVSETAPQPEHTITITHEGDRKSVRVQTVLPNRIPL